MAEPLLRVEDLSIDLALANGTLHAVRNVDFTLNRSEALGIVGESGCGKSMTALGLMRLLPGAARLTARKLSLGESDMNAMSEREFVRSVCGVGMSMIFQEPMTSLNPVYTIGRQLTETMLIRDTASKTQARDRAIHLLEKVGIPEPEQRLHQYPHQLSGGQRQRVMIAMALMNGPDLIIADEPTTALDVTIQAQILHLLADLQRELGMAMILITHDLGVVSRTVDRIAVMYAGEFVETGTAREIFTSPRHPYTRGLLECIPESGTALDNGRLGAIAGIVPSLIGNIQGCAFKNRCPVAVDQCWTRTPEAVDVSPGRACRCHLAAENPVEARLAPEANDRLEPVETGEGDPVPVLATEGVDCVFKVRRSIFAKTRELRAVDNVSLDLRRSEVLALVGESGCGKTTLAKIILGLQPASNGRIRFDGKPLNSVDQRDRARRIQPIFQDPYSSLNPRKTIGQIIQRPLDIHEVGDPDGRRRQVEEIMEMVGLPDRLIHSYPSQVSGGQRQRVAIARAIVMRPEILICDEPTSALDVSVQSQILNLLLDLRDELGLTYLVITHNLAVVDFMATRIAVMYLGQIVELGNKHDVINTPSHPYTRALLGSVLSLNPDAGLPALELGAGFPNPLDLPSGCRFHPRCPQATAECPTTMPDLRTKGGSAARCLLVE